MCPSVTIKIMNFLIKKVKFTNKFFSVCEIYRGLFRSLPTPCKNVSNENSLKNKSIMKNFKKFLSRSERFQKLKSPPATKDFSTSIIICPHVAKITSPGPKTPVKYIPNETIVTKRENENFSRAHSNKPSSSDPQSISSHSSNCARPSLRASAAAQWLVDFYTPFSPRECYLGRSRGNTAHTGAPPAINS